MTPFNLSEHPEAFRARSLPIPLQVRFAKEDGEVATLEGPVRHQAGDAIVTGTHGEQWPVPSEKFLATYVPVPPTQSGQDGLYSKRSCEVWALHIRTPIAVELSSGRGFLNGKEGDVLVEYSPGDQAVVAGLIFEQTYRRIEFA